MAYSTVNIPFSNITEPPQPTTNASAPSSQECLKDASSASESASESEPCLKDSQDEATQTSSECLKSTQETSSEPCLKDTPESTSESNSQPSKDSKSGFESGKESSSCLNNIHSTTNTPSEQWPVADDKALREIKEAKQVPSWAEVAKALNRSVLDVKARWKVIKDAPTLSDTQDKPDTKQASSKDKPKEAKKESKLEPKEPVIQPKSTETPILSGEEASSEASLPCPQRQKRFLTTHVHSKLYPPYIQPVSDAHFSQHDCDVLAAADSRYKRARWLEMQANFFNVTGRMVPLEIIRNKIEGAKSLKGDLEKLEVDEKAKSTELWVNSLL